MPKKPINAITETLDDQINKVIENSTKNTTNKTKTLNKTKKQRIRELMIEHNILDEYEKIIMVPPKVSPEIVCSICSNHITDKEG